MNKLKTKNLSIKFLMVVMGIGFGILISAQFRSVPNRISNPVIPYISLKETKEDLYKEQTELKESIKKLQDSITKAQKEVKNITLSESELYELNAKKAEAGLTKVSGQGIIINLDDSKSAPTTEDSIVHASDLRDIVNLLWSSGAEAIAINDQRVTLNTAIDCIVNTILIDNQRISAPFMVKAVGSKNLLSLSMKELSGLEKRKKSDGLVFDYSKASSIIIPAYSGSFGIKEGDDV